MKLYVLPLLFASVSAGGLKKNPYDSDAPVRELKSGSGKSKSGSSKSKSKSKSGSVKGFQANTRLQTFTPAYMFSIGMDTSTDEFTYVTDKDAFVYQIAPIFGDGEGDESACNSIGCMEEYYSFATKGKKKSPTEWSVNVATTGSLSSFNFICPLATMTPRVEGECVVQASSPGVGTRSPGIFTVSIERGPTADGITDDCSGEDYYLLELICTGTEDDIKVIESYDEADSPGFDSRPYNDAAIMAKTGEGGSFDCTTFWTPDRDVTTFEIVDFDEGNGNACSIMGCSAADEVMVYFRGNDALYGEISKPGSGGGCGFDDDDEYICPRGDMIVSLTPLCDGSATTWDIPPQYRGAQARSGEIVDGCTVETLKIECTIPEPSSAPSSAPTPTPSP